MQTYTPTDPAGKRRMGGSAMKTLAQETLEQAKAATRNADELFDNGLYFSANAAGRESLRLYNLADALEDIEPQEAAQ